MDASLFLGHGQVREDPRRLFFTVFDVGVWVLDGCLGSSWGTGRWERTILGIARFNKVGVLVLGGVLTQTHVPVLDLDFVESKVGFLVLDGCLSTCP